MSRTTAIVLVPVGLTRQAPHREGGSARRSGLSRSGRPSLSWSSGSAPRRTTGSPFSRSTYSLVLLSLGSHIRRVSASRRALTSSTVQTFHPASSRSATWRHVSAIRLAGARLRRRSPQGLLHLVLLRPLEPRRVLTSGATDYHGAQPGPPPLRQPLTYRHLDPLDHLRDSIQDDTAPGAQICLPLE